MIIYNIRIFFGEYIIMKQPNENLSEKILISLGLVMLAAIIGYNAFFVPDMPQTVRSEGNIVQKKQSAREDSGKNSLKSALVNINTASEQELCDNLTGIGPAIAKRIISYRKSHGGFSSKEELMNVKGIGEKVFVKLKNNISVE